MVEQDEWVLLVVAALIGFVLGTYACPWMVVCI